MQETGLNAKDVAQIVAAAATVLAVAFAAWSAWLSRAAVERANMAFVWPAFTIGHEDTWDDRGPFGVRVRLHADGPGVALDVRWSLYFPDEPGREKYVDAEAAASASAAIRAMRPGESWPEEDGQWSEMIPVPPPPHDDLPYSILVRWSDSAGRRWEFTEAGTGRELAKPPRRVSKPAW
jgi:hypothetical protein